MIEAMNQHTGKSKLHLMRVLSMLERESSREVLPHTGHVLDQSEQLSINALLVFLTLITDQVGLRGGKTIISIIMSTRKVEQ